MAAFHCCLRLREGIQRNVASRCPKVPSLVKSLEVRCSVSAGYRHENGVPQGSDLSVTPFTVAINRIINALVHLSQHDWMLM
jgi:hypothetical protein